MRGSGAVRAGAPPAFGRCCAKPVHPGPKARLKTAGDAHPIGDGGNAPVTGWNSGNAPFVGLENSKNVCRLEKQQSIVSALGSETMLFPWLRWIRVSEGPGGPYPERSHTRDKIFDPTFGAVRRNADNGERTYKQRQGLQAERRWPPSRRSGMALGEKRG